LRTLKNRGGLQITSKNDKALLNCIPNEKKESTMLNGIKVNLSRREIIGAVKAMKKRERESFLEELLAATSPEYLESIKEARADYMAGRTKRHDEVFGH
jgi:hypothetical protein